MSEVVLSNSGLAGLAEEINREHEAVGTALNAGFQHALTAGQLLAAAKNRVLHGEWRSWLQANCAASERTAQSYMRLAREWHHVDTTVSISDAPAVPRKSAVWGLGFSGSNRHTWSRLAEPPDQRIRCFEG